MADEPDGNSGGEAETAAPRAISELPGLETPADFFRDAFHNAPLAYNKFDKQGRIIAVNREFCRMLGYDPYEALELTIADVRANNSQADHRRFERCLRGETIEGAEVQMLRKDGHQVWVELHVRPIIADNGEVVAGRAMIVDITERKRAQQKLEASERRYRRLADVVPEALFIHIDDVIRWSNQAAREMFRCEEPDELIGREISELVPASNVSKIRERIERVRSGQTDVLDTYEQRVFALDGTAVEVEGTATVCEFDGQMGMLVALRDIGRRRRLEEESRKARRLESLGVMAGGIAHDFSNLLAVLSSNLAFARKHFELDAGLAQVLTDCEEALVQGKELTDQLQSFAAGRTLRTEPSLVTPLVEKAVEMALRGTRLSCEREFASRWKVAIDTGKIKQVLNNLVINAVEATAEQGRLEVSVTDVVVEPSESEVPLPWGDYVRISIADDGHGINEDEIDQIFDPFFTTKETGSGLGLANAYAIVQEHGGLLRACSEPGAGATFDIYLPRVGNGA